MASIKIPAKLPAKYSFLTSEDLQQMSHMIRQGHHPDVIHIEYLTGTRSKKLITFHNMTFTVLYSTKTKTVMPVDEELPVGPFISSNEKKRRLKKFKHREHTKQRLLERFNIEASEEDLQKMALMCHTKYRHIKLPFSSTTQGPGRTRNLIHFKDTDMLAIYEPESDSIVTAMPTDFMFKEERDWLYCSKRVRYKQLLKHAKELPSHAL